MPPSDIEYSMNAEFAGERPVEDTLALLQDIQTPGSIDTISLAVTSEAPIDRTALSTETTQSEHTAPSDADTTSRTQQSTLHAASQPTAVLRHLATTDDWTLSDDLHDELSSDVNSEQLASILYNLADRGFVYKRPHEADKRKREYRLSEQGQTALEKLDN